MDSQACNSPGLRLPHLLCLGEARPRTGLGAGARRTSNMVQVTRRSPQKQKLRVPRDTWKCMLSTETCRAEVKRQMGRAYLQVCRELQAILKAEESDPKNGVGEHLRRLTLRAHWVASKSQQKANQTCLQQTGACAVVGNQAFSVSASSPPARSVSNSQNKSILHPFKKLLCLFQDVFIDVKDRVNRERENHREKERLSTGSLPK